MTLTHRSKARLLPSANSYFLVDEFTTKENSPHATIGLKIYDAYDDIDTFSIHNYEDNELLYVSPEGYFFAHETLYGMLCLNTGEQEKNVHRTVLKNVMDHHPSIVINDFIDKSMAAQCDDGNKRFVCGVNQTHDAIYAYAANGNKLGSALPPIFKITEPNNKITAIVSTRIEKENDVYKEGDHLIIALQNGLICLGQIREGQFVLEYQQLLPYIDDKMENTILASLNGKFIQYTPALNRLFIYDLQHAEGKGLITDKSLYNLKLSVDGNYLTGLQYQGGLQSDRVHCYNLETNAHHKIKLMSPATDFLVGGDENHEVTALAYPPVRESWSDIPKLVDMGPLNDVLAYGNWPVPVVNVEERKQPTGGWARLLDGAKSVASVVFYAGDKPDSGYRP